MNTHYNSVDANKNIDQFINSLVEWTQKTLVSTTDAIGRYGYKGNPWCDMHELTNGDLKQHYNYNQTIGGYSLNSDNQGKTITIDIDAHDEELAVNPSLPAENLQTVMEIYLHLEELGMFCILEDSDGRGGYKVRIPFSSFVDYQSLHSFGKWLIQGLGEYEVFPKSKRSVNGIGNFVRFPGKHHKRQHISKFWDGSKWVGMDYLLTVSGNDASLIPSEALNFAVKPAKDKRDRKPKDKNKLDVSDLCDYLLDWDTDILTPHGFKYLKSKEIIDEGGEVYTEEFWARNEDIDHHGLSIKPHEGREKLTCWTNNAAPLEQVDESGKGRYTKFACYATLNYSGEDKFKQAAKELSQKPDFAKKLNPDYLQKIEEIDFSYELQKPERNQSTMRNRTYSPAEYLSIPPARYLVSRHIIENSLCTIYGPSGAGKSFFGLELAFDIAEGKTLFNIFPTRKSGVLYLVSESDGTFGPRMQAWAKHNDKDLSTISNFRLLPEAFNFQDVDNTVKQIANIVNSEFAVKPGVIFIDTLNRNIHGDENSPKDMNAFVRTCELLRAIFKCAIIIIHHSGKEDGRGPRGHSSLFAACDSVIKVDGKPEDLQATIYCEKVKSGKPFASYVLNKTVVELDINDPDNPDSVVLTHLGDQISQSDKLATFIGLFPCSEDKAITLHNLLSKDKGTLNTLQWNTVKTLQNNVGLAVSLGKLDIHKDDKGKKGISFRYYRLGIPEQKPQQK